MDSSSTIPSKAESPQGTNNDIQRDHESAVGVTSIVMTDTEAQEAGENNSTEEHIETSATEDKDHKEDQDTDDEGDRCWPTIIEDIEIVNDDRSEIFDPKTMQFIPMPSIARRRRRP